MEKVHRAIAVRKPRWLILLLVTFAIGVGSGLGAMALALLLRLVQHIAYGHGLHTIVGRVSFLQEVTAASDLRRVFAPFFCGGVAGVGWWRVFSFFIPVGFFFRAGRKDARLPFLSVPADPMLYTL